MNKEKLKVGVIGVGRLGEFHVQKYVALPEVELVGVVDTNLHRANEIAQRYNTKTYGDHGDILPLVDAVSCAVPTEMHFDVAKDILSEGVHLLLEIRMNRREYLGGPRDLWGLAGRSGRCRLVGLAGRAGLCHPAGR